MSYADTDGLLLFTHLPSEDIKPDKAKKILHDKEVKGKTLTEKQRGMFGAAAGRTDHADYGMVSDQMKINQRDKEHQRELAHKKTMTEAGYGVSTQPGTYLEYGPTGLPINQPYAMSSDMFVQPATKPHKTVAPSAKADPPPEHPKAGAGKHESRSLQSETSDTKQGKHDAGVNLTTEPSPYAETPLRTQKGTQVQYGPTGLPINQPYAIGDGGLSQGPSMQGRALQGPSMQGRASQGAFAQGRASQGPLAQGGAGGKGKAAVKPLGSLTSPMTTSSVGTSPAT